MGEDYWWRKLAQQWREGIRGGWVLPDGVGLEDAWWYAGYCERKAERWAKKHAVPH